MISGSFLRDTNHVKGSEEHLGPKRNINDTRKCLRAVLIYEVRERGAWERLIVYLFDEKKTNVLT